MFVQSDAAFHSVSKKLSDAAIVDDASIVQNLVWEATEEDVNWQDEVRKYSIDTASAFITFPILHLF